ncbi:MAG: hypothetical protein J0L64_25980 [Acidobacteria bacterium]|nr:hypothetical protein [Acidobacteriota bacterium]
MSGMGGGNKEINIINMSLLDILCGAMGAFCFMMLALFPYWSPAGVGAKESAQMAEQMQQEMERLKEQLRRSGGPGAADALERLEQLQRQMQQREGENNQLRGELEAAREKVKDLEIRNPVVVAANWSTPAHDIDVFIHTPELKSTSGKSQPPPDPNKKQGHFYGGDISFGMSRGPGMDFWLMRDTIAGSRCDIYYKFIASNGNAQPAVIYGSYINNSNAYPLPSVEMRQEKTVFKIGTLVINGDYSLKFEPVPALADAYRRQLEQANKPPGGGQ